MPMFDFFKRSKNKDGCTTCGCGELKNEFAQEHPTYNNYISEGVTINTEGDSISVEYNGLLAKNGAQDIYAAVNYGDNQNWDNAKYYQMDKTGSDSFKALLPINENLNINVAFKDSADNWDNNSGKNYSFISH